VREYEYKLRIDVIAAALPYNDIARHGGSAK